MFLAFAISNKLKQLLLWLIEYAKEDELLKDREINYCRVFSQGFNYRMPMNSARSQQMISRPTSKGFFAMERTTICIVFQSLLLNFFISKQKAQFNETVFMHISLRVQHFFVLHVQLIDIKFRLVKFSYILKYFFHCSS